MNKRLKVIATILTIIVVIIIVAIKLVDKPVNEIDNEPDYVETIKGTVLEVNGTSILINEIGVENAGECYLYVDKDTEYYNGDDKVDISSVKVGKNITAVYTGGIAEVYPGVIDKVIKVTVE